MDFSSFLKKLKHFEFKKSYAVLIVILALIIRFWGVNSVTLLQKDIPIIDSTEISAEEINHYIQTKQQYIEDNISIDSSIIVSRDIETYLDKDTHEWFLLRGWRPKRFFYVEERMKLIVSLAHDRTAKMAEAQRLESQALLTDSNVQGVFSEEITPAELNKMAQDIKYNINRDIRFAGITEAEDNEIMKNISTIEYLLEK